MYNTERYITPFYEVNLDCAFSYGAILAPPPYSEGQRVWVLLSEDRRFERDLGLFDATSIAGEGETLHFRVDPDGACLDTQEIYNDYGDSVGKVQQDAKIGWATSRQTVKLEWKTD